MRKEHTYRGKEVSEKDGLKEAWDGNGGSDQGPSVTTVHLLSTWKVVVVPGKEKNVFAPTNSKFYKDFSKLLQ